MEQYTIGVDFGTLSARAVLLRCGDGAAVARAEHAYEHGVMDRQLPDGTPLPPGTALQDPMDYPRALEAVVREVAGAVDPAAVIGLGIDFTSATILPVDEALTPLSCRHGESLHAWCKLWKHHGGQPQADRMTALCARMGVDLSRLGGRISSEWTLPKVMETREKAPQVYSDARYFVEAGDWLVWLLTGTRGRSACMAGFKCHYDGAWPDDSFFRALGLDPEKLTGPVVTAGSRAGGLTDQAAEKLGLLPGTAVTAPLIDAHGALPGAGIRGDGEMMLILGTSACHILLSREDKAPRGICGKVRDGVLPGYFAYETGQSSLGDTFGWFMENCVPARYERQAGERGIWKYMEDLAGSIAPGEDPVYALDWWNGSRSPYGDFTLTGTLFGCTLQTRPEHIYRALMEAAAFGTKQILSLLADGGVPIRRIVAGGGIPGKNPLFMQILADVLGRPIQVCADPDSSARGSGVMAAWAAGAYPAAEDAIEAMTHPTGITYFPDPKASQAYAGAYARYLGLAEMFSAPADSE